MEVSKYWPNWLTMVGGGVQVITSLVESHYNTAFWAFLVVIWCAGYTYQEKQSWK